MGGGWVSAKSQRVDRTEGEPRVGEESGWQCEWAGELDEWWWMRGECGESFMK